MSLERQDVRAKLDADTHRALTAICSARGVTVAEFIEGLLVPEIRRLVHEAKVIVAGLPDTGISARGRE